MKTKLIALLLIINSNFVISQNILNFNKKFVQSEDQWVSFQMSKDSTYNFGFIYIDAQAGLTFDSAGSFIIGPKGEFITSNEKRLSSIKARLEPNNVLVAHIPESKFQELKIEKTPEWLRFYKDGENSKERLYKWGYMYNGWNECEKALEFLEKANKIDSTFRGLKVELAYSYNCLGRYNDAEKVLEEALKIEPKYAYTNKELIFAQAHGGKMDLAEQSFKRALVLCDEKTYDAENAFQILQGYFLKKDVKNFKRWLSEYQNLIETDERFPPIIKNMKKEIKQ